MREATVIYGELKNVLVGHLLLTTSWSNIKHVLYRAERAVGSDREELERLRLATRSRAPCGSGEFVRALEQKVGLCTCAHAASAQQQMAASAT